jgi:hypothetical protein
MYGVYGWESVILLCLSLLLFCLWLLPVVAKEPVTEIVPQTK